MKQLTSQKFAKTLQSLGVGSGDIVHVQSDLRTIGPVDSATTREAILDFYWRVFQEVLGPEGTLTCCTAFEDYARYGKPFVLEESPSLTDTLSEYVRTRPGSVRSLHPIVSVTGWGARAEEICGGNHWEGFGYDSPWGRLHRANALILSLGLNAYEGGTTFFHYPESLYSVPYKYTKLYRTPVFARGEQVQGTFTLSVRYLDFGIANTPQRIKPRLLAVGKAKLEQVGRSYSWACRAQDAFDECIGCLGRDRYFLLETAPKFRAGEIPMDGLTGDMQHSVDRSRDGQE